MNDVREALALKADVSAMGALAGRGDSGASTGMNGYVAPADVISAVRESREAVVTAKRATEEAREAGGGVRELREELAQLSRALEGKSDAKEMCRLLDTKAGAGLQGRAHPSGSPPSPSPPPSAAVEEVNQSLVEINKELDAKAEADAVRPIAAEQNALAQVVRVELAGGRWIWKSGRVSRGGRVPWNVQSVNHCPENLLWEPDGDRVTTVMPGLYALSLGVFCDRMPRVRVLVNNETVFVVPSEADGADTFVEARGLDPSLHTPPLTRTHPPRPPPLRPRPARAAQRHESTATALATCPVGPPPSTWPSRRAPRSRSPTAGPTAPRASSACASCRTSQRGRNASPPHRYSWSCGAREPHRPRNPKSRPSSIASTAMQ